MRITIAFTGERAVAVASPEADLILASIGPAVVKHRASYVLPERLALRLAFVLLRGLFGEQGRVAAWTRSWRCSWRVDLSPSGGPVLPERWTDRAEAIRAEVSWLNEHLAQLP